MAVGGQAQRVRVDVCILLVVGILSLVVLCKFVNLGIWECCHCLHHCLHDNVAMWAMFMTMLLMLPRRQ
jgi:fumarate reductase subunit D